MQILDRGVPVARITRLPASGTDGEERRQRLVDAGILRPGAGDISAVLQRPPVELAVNLSGALDDERADRL